MSERVGPKGQQWTGTHHPSGLRNELRAGSDRDGEAPDERRGQVPDSDTVIPETQLEDLQRHIESSPMLHDGGSDPSLSPGSQALLNKNRVIKTTHAPEVDSEVKYLKRTKLDIEEPSTTFVFGSHGRAVPNRYQKGNMTTPSVPSPPTAESSASLPDMNNVGKGVAVDEGLRHSLTFGSPKHSEELPGPLSLPQSEPASKDERETSVVTPDAYAEETSGGDNGIDRLKVPLVGNAGALHPRPRPKSSSNSKAPSGKKAKKTRKHKLRQQDTQWPPRSQNTDSGSVQPQPLNNEQPILDVLHEEHDQPDHHEQVNGGHIDAARTARQETADSSANTPAPAHSLPEMTTSHPPDAREEEGISPQQDNDDPQGSSQARQPISQTHDRPFIKSSATAEMQRHESENILHETSSRNGPVRIEKSRKKPRLRGPPQLQGSSSAFNGAATKLSPENDTLLGFIAAALHAGEHKARDIVGANSKAQAAAIAALQETIRLKNDTIDGLRGENGDLHQTVKKIQGKSSGLQKFIDGLGRDYNKLKAEAQDHKEKCKQDFRKGLHENVAQFEKEKSSLIEEWTKLVASLERNKDKIRTVANDLYSRVLFLESRKKDLAEQLSKQSKLYEEEKNKRSELEQQIMPALQSFGKQLDDGGAKLYEKLESIRGSFDTTAAEERTSPLKECIDAVRTLSATPFATTDDLTNAEGMLRDVHESIGTKLEELATDTKNNHFPMDDIQNYVQGQMQKLRDDVLKYDEAVNQCREERHSNERLSEQLDCQKVHFAKLEEQVRIHRQNEVNLESRCSQLEEESNGLRDVAREHDLKKSGLEHELASLRLLARKAEDDLQAKIIELGHVNERVQQQTTEVATTKELVEEQKRKIIELARKIQESSKIKKSADNASLIRGIEERYRKLLKEKEIALGNDIHRLKCDRDSQEAAASTLQNELEAAKNKLQAAEDNARSSASQATKLWEAKSEAEKQLKKLRTNADDELRKASELLDVKERLAQKIDALRAKDNDLDALRKEFAESKIESTNQQEEHGRLLAQLAEEEASIESLRKDLMARDALQQKDKSALLEANNRAGILQQEKRDVESKLEHSRANETKLNDAQAKFSIEKESLQLELTKLRTTMRLKDEELSRMQNDATEALKKAEDDHNTKSNELRRRLTQAEQTAKEAETNARRIQIEKSRELDAHKKEVDKKFEFLVNEKLKERVQRDGNGQQQAPGQAQPSEPSASVTRSRSELTSTLRVVKPRKKASRHNSSVLSVVGASQEESTPISSQLGAPQISYSQQEENLADEEFIEAELAGELGSRERLDENGVSIVDPASETVPETQESLTSTFNHFNLGLNQVPGSDDDSYSSLSDAPPRMSDPTEVEDVASIPRGPRSLTYRDHEKLRQGATDSKTPSRKADISAEQNVRSSQDRPKSQANTASRMMPPPTPDPSAKRNSQGSMGASRTKRSQASQKSDVDNKDIASSPDFVRRQSSAPKTYGHPAGKSATSRTYQRGGTPQMRVEVPVSKRKISEDSADDSSSSKRARSSSPTVLSPAPRFHQRQGSATPSTASRLRGHKGAQETTETSQGQTGSGPKSMTHATGEYTPYTRRTGRGGRRSRMDERFERELQGGSRDTR